MSNPIEKYYDSQAETEWGRFTGRFRMEYAVTSRLLDIHLPSPPATVLDVGGGPGRYAIDLAKRGYDVTLVDISSRELDLAREKAREAGIHIVDYVRASATDLAMFTSESFDAVLLMGPLYHLHDAGERVRAVSEALRVLRPERPLFAAFITRTAPIRDLAKHHPEAILTGRERFEQILDTGILDQPGGFTDAYLAEPSEVRPFMERAGRLQTIDLVGVEGATCYIEEGITSLDGDEWNAWVELNVRLGRASSIHGASDHLLYVGLRQREGRAQPQERKH